MAKSKPKQGSEKEGIQGVGGILGGLSSLLERLGELAEKGLELKKSGEFADSDAAGKIRGVYGFTVRSGLKGNESGIQVEPFGNMGSDRQTGQAVVHEVREPMVDIFEEPDHVLIVAELPGISEDDLQLELRDDILLIAAEHGTNKYRKEVLLPAAFPREKMSRSCRNGILEVRFQK